MRRDIALLYVALVLRYAAPLILVPFYGRHLGGEAYGQLLSAMALSQVVWIFIEWGLPTTGLRDVAALNDRGARARLLSNHWLARTLLALVVVPIAGLSVWLIPILNADPWTSGLAIAWGCLSAYNLTWYFQGRQKMQTAAVIEVLGLAATTLFILVTVEEPNDVWKIPLTMAVAASISTAIQNMLAYKDSGWILPNLRYATRLVQQSLSMFTFRGLGILLSPVTVLAVGAVAPPNVAGSFALADRLSSIVMAFVTPLNQVFSGAVNKLAGNCSPDHQSMTGATQAIRNYASRVFLVATALTFVAIASADLVIPLVIGTGHEYIIQPFRIACVGSYLSMLAGLVVGYGMLPFRHDVLVTKLAAIGMVATVACSVTGVLWFGLNGAIAGRAIACFLSLVVSIWALHHVGLYSYFAYRRPVAQT